MTKREAKLQQAVIDSHVTDRALADLKAYRRRHVHPRLRREWEEFQASRKSDAEAFAEVFGRTPAN